MYNEKCHKKALFTVVYDEGMNYLIYWVKNMILIFCMALIDDENDRDRFEEIYMTYRKKMIYTAEQVLGNYQDAEDAVHETFIKIARNMQSLEGMTSSEVFSYVIKAAQNTAINMKKARKKHDYNLNIDDCIDLDDKSALIDLCTFENYEPILRCIEQMDVFYREVFYLYYVEDLSAPEIADKLGRKPATVRKQISRSKQMFMDNFKMEVEENG